jgi:hypothetical protein
MPVATRMSDPTMPPPPTRNAAGTPEPPAPRFGGHTALYVVLGLALAVAVVLVALIPSDTMLQWTLKPVLFHGASTWINLLTFTLAGLLAIVYLFSRRPGTYAYVAATRYVSFSLWILNTLLGMFSAYITWGSAFWSEPRLQLSFWILLVIAVAMAVDILMDKPVIHSALDIAIALGVWVFVVYTPKDIHPNSPVFAAGTDWSIKAIFAGLVLAWGVAMLVVIRLWAERLARLGAGVPGMPDAED